MLMERITDRMLRFSLERLNDQTKCRYQIGRSYGYYHLERASMECTGIDSVSMGNTKRELYYQIQTHLKIQEAEKNRKADYIKNCSHYDVFNIHHIKEGEKVKAGHIFEYELKGKTVYQCITCQKFFTKSEYETNQKLKSHDELIKLRVRE